MTVAEQVRIAQHARETATVRRKKFFGCCGVKQLVQLCCRHRLLLHPGLRPVICHAGTDEELVDYLPAAVLMPL